MYTKDLLTIYIDSQGNISDTLIFFFAKYRLYFWVCLFIGIILAQVLLKTGFHKI